MENKLYKEFLGLFSFLPEAGSIIFDDNVYHDELRLKLISGMQQATEKIILSHQPNQRLFDEIKENLLLNTLDKEGYLRLILSDFKDIAAYLNISSDKEYCTFFRVPALKIGEIYYSEYHISIHRLLERHCNSIEPFLEYDKATIPELFVIECFHAYSSFFQALDALCFNFEIDLYDIHTNRMFQVFERDESSLLSNGIPVKQIGKSRGKNKDNPLIFEESILDGFHSVFNNYLWESTDIESCKNWFRVSPIGKPIFKHKMTSYFCYAIGGIESQRKIKICPNIQNWYSNLTCKETKMSKLKNQVVGDKKIEVNVKINQIMSSIYG